MSAQFEFTSVDRERNGLIIDRFCELASRTHTTCVTEGTRPGGCRLVRLRRLGEDGQRLYPLEDGYHFALGIAYDKDGKVALRTTGGADHAETILHPLVDILVDVLIHFRVTWFDFGESMYGSLEVHAHRDIFWLAPEPRQPSTIPCSGQTLQRLFSSENLSEIRCVFGRVRIGQDLIQAFACPENNSTKDLELRVAFYCCNIVDYFLLGQSLRNNPLLRRLTIEPKRNHNVVPLFQTLSGHAKLKILNLKVCGRSLTEELSNAMWTAILGLRSLDKLNVQQGNDDVMHWYTFDGLWNMLSQHESINNVYFGHHSPMWTVQHIDTIKNTLLANPRIVCIRKNPRGFTRSMIGKWNREVEPLLIMNQLQIQIHEIMSQHDPTTRSAEWLELLITKSDSVSSLYHILRETVDLWVCSFLPIVNSRKRARHSA